MDIQNGRFVRIRLRCGILRDDQSRETSICRVGRACDDFRHNSLLPGIACLALFAIGTASCSSAHSAATNGVAPTKSAGRTVEAAAPIFCRASVSTSRPASHALLGVRVTATPSVHVKLVTAYPAGRRLASSRIAASGRRTFWYRVPHTPPSFRVVINIIVFKGRRVGICHTWYRIRERRSATAPAPLPSATPKPTRSTGSRSPRAWCKATATVYNASQDQNNVYVNSNQPHSKATARADGYSGSYETNGSGYAEIYLNGPQRGAKVTVSVGGATCYTSV